MMNRKLFLLCFFIGLVSARQINQAGVNLVKEFEGWYPNFYKDSVGIRTIGYGHACHVNDCSKIHPPLTHAQGEALLRSDLAIHEKCVESHAPKLTDNRFAALVSFSFNLGCGALSSSALLKDVKAHNWHAAAGQFGVYVHAGGRVLKGLVRRRAAERALFCHDGGC